MPAAPAVTYRAAGVALGRFTPAGAWRPDYAWEARMMVEHFLPGTVPLLTRHGGLPIAYLDTLRAEDADLHFTTGPVTDAGIIEELRRGHGISIETARRVERLPDGSWPPGTTFTADVPLAERFTVQRRYFTGTLKPGPNLVGVALSDRPAAYMSTAWLVREDL